MEIINTVTRDEIEKAAKALSDGHLVAFPTETVYGLGADATNEKAVSKIYSVKGRPLGHPLIVHVSDLCKIQNWTSGISDLAIELGRKFWPGPLTIILKRSKLAKNFITGNQDYVALRVPEHPVALNLIRYFENFGGMGVVAPSANRFGAVSPTSAGDVAEELGFFLSREDLIIDGGNCDLGIESTIIDCTGFKPMILRPGFITAQQIEIATGIRISTFAKKNNLVSPGQLVSHYSPRAEIIVSSEVFAGEGFIAMDVFPTPVGAFRLASPKSIEEYAKVLYKAFRAADHKGLTKIKIIPPSGSELAASIVDRINKASVKSLKQQN